jgi:hypothetical protein
MVHLQRLAGMVILSPLSMELLQKTMDSAVFLPPSTVLLQLSVATEVLPQTVDLVVLLRPSTVLLQLSVATELLPQTVDLVVLLRPSTVPLQILVPLNPIKMVLLQLMVDLVTTSLPDMVCLPVPADLEALMEHQANMLQTEDMITHEESTEQKLTISL